MVSNHQDQGPTVSTGDAQASTASEKRHRILVISVVNVSWIRQIYSFMLDAIESRADLHHATESLDAFIQLSSWPPPDAVIVTDEAVAVARYAQLGNGVFHYIRQGGTAIFTCLFSCFMPISCLNRFFQRTGLNWRWKSYREANMYLNRGPMPQAVAERLPEQYLQTGVLVNNVDPEDAWYQNIDDWLMEESAFDGEALRHPTNETAAALGRFGDGKIGYVSDIVLGNGSLNIVLAMCGIL